MTHPTRILVVDNYDSFVYTIVGYLDQLGAQTVVVRNDAVPEPDADGRFRDADGTVFDGVLVSPG
ncbi:MAG: glutamine amidotransferase-related protein, partial [Cellulosimicrobium funkei]